MARISLDGGYTCPNRDGTLADNGCAYCGEGSRGLIARSGTITRQYQAAIARRRESRFIPYFQAYSGTYAPLTVLRDHWDTAERLPGACGLAVSTRPDCLQPDIVADLAQRARRIPLWVEVGLESAHDETLRRMGRAHDSQCFVHGVERLAAAGVPTVAHIIFGWPGETPQQALDSIAFLQSLPIWGIKIHPFHVVAGSPIAALWQRGRLELMGAETYAELAARAITMLPDHWIIHRLTGAGAGPKHLAPDWAVQPRKLLNRIDRILEANGWIQGCATSDPGVPLRYTRSQQPPSAPASR